RGSRGRRRPRWLHGMPAVRLQAGSRELRGGDIPLSGWLGRRLRLIGGDRGPSHLGLRRLATGNELFVACEITRADGLIELQTIVGGIASLVQARNGLPANDVLDWSGGVVGSDLNLPQFVDRDFHVDGWNTGFVWGCAVDHECPKGRSGRHLMVGALTPHARLFAGLVDLLFGVRDSKADFRV